MKIYIIRQVAVYYHEILGVMDDKEAAIEEAKRLASLDCDSHHEFVVTEHCLNHQYNNIPKEFSCRDMPPCKTEVNIFTCRKG